jgi:hypothetical protein
MSLNRLTSKLKSVSALTGTGRQYSMGAFISLLELPFGLCDTVIEKQACFGSQIMPVSCLLQISSGERPPASLKMRFFVPLRPSCTAKQCEWRLQKNRARRPKPVTVKRFFKPFILED